MRQNSAVSFVFFFFAIVSDDFEDVVELHVRVLAGSEDSVEDFTIRELSHDMSVAHVTRDSKMALPDLPRRGTSLPLPAAAAELALHFVKPFEVRLEDLARKRVVEQEIGAAVRERLRHRLGHVEPRQEVDDVRA